MLLMEFGPWSVIHTFGAVYGLINFSTSASAISADVACLSGTAIENLISKSFIVSIYECPLSVVESALTDTLLTRYLYYSLYLWELGCRIFMRTSFFNWQFRHSCIYFCISNFIPEPEIIMMNSPISLCLYDFLQLRLSCDFRRLFGSYRIFQVCLHSYTSRLSHDYLSGGIVK